MTDLTEVNGYNMFMVIVHNFGKLNWLVPCRAGEGQLTALQVAYCFLTVGLDSLVYRGMSYTTATYVLLRPFGRHYEVCLVRELCLAALITLRLMVRLSGKTVPLSRL